MNWLIEVPHACRLEMALFPTLIVYGSGVLCCADVASSAINVTLDELLHKIV
jgi:hypothetical protein